MKPAKTKQEIRAELDRETADYVGHGGVVENVPRGKSGNETNRNLFGSFGANSQPQKRTSLDDVVKVLDERKVGEKTKSMPKRSGPRKKLITDDFGDPLRWVWVED